MKVQLTEQSIRNKNSSISQEWVTQSALSSIQAARILFETDLPAKYKECKIETFIASPGKLLPVPSSIHVATVLNNPHFQKSHKAGLSLGHSSSWTATCNFKVTKPASETGTTKNLSLPKLLQESTVKKQLKKKRANSHAQNK